MASEFGEFTIESLKNRLLPEISATEPDESGRPFAAVAIIIQPHNAGGRVLLIKRTERLGDPWSGQVAFPGGHKGEADGSLLETAVREAREEVGIQLSNNEVLGLLPLVYPRTRRVVVAPFVFQLSRDVSVHLNEEVAESFWVKLTELQSLKPTKTEVAVTEGKLVADCYLYQGNIIWGMTFRIINSLLDKTASSNL